MERIEPKLQHRLKPRLKNYGRHKILMRFMRALPAWIASRILGYTCVKEKGPKCASLIISNHNSNIDPALVSRAFTGHSYYLASEHSFRMGLLSKFLVFVFDPIPFYKVKADTSSLKEMLRRLKAGASVCLFAEGNRSFNGLTGHIPLSTAKLIKMAEVPLITFRFQGGYFTTPRWSKSIRKGKMTGAVVGHYSAEEIKTKTAEQLIEIIRRDLHEDAYQRQRKNPVPYRGKDLAEYIELILYLCPLCEKIGTIKSRGNRFFCTCGLDAIYTETCFLEASPSQRKELKLPFSTITEWDKWQVKVLENIVNSSGGNIICADDNQKLFIIKPNYEKELCGEGVMQISRNEIQCAGRVFPLEQISRYAIVGEMTLTFAIKDGTMYEVCSDIPRSAKKYLEVLRILRNEIE